MRPRILLPIAALFWVSVFQGAGHAEVPGMIHFQGLIELPEAEMRAEAEGHGEKDNSRPKPFDGTGRFRFSIVDSAGVALWTNTPGSLNPVPPSQVSIPVKNGIFNVALGDPVLGMPPITAGVFDRPDRLLRVFFQGEIRDEKGRLKKTTPDRELLPAQRLLTVPFAFATATAGKSLDREALGTLLVGATVQGHLTVVGPLKVGSNTIILGPTAVGQANTLAFDGGPGFIETIDPAGSSLTLRSSGAQPIIMSPGGNVGIGNAAPAEKLHVAGKMRASGQLLSDEPTLPPLVVASNALVPNLNADLLDGFHAADLMAAGPPSPRIMYKTLATFTGAQARTPGNCAPGFHFCTITEIFGVRLSTAVPGASPTPGRDANEGGWIDPMSNLDMGFTTDCLGWTSSNPNHTGTYMGIDISETQGQIGQLPFDIEQRSCSSACNNGPCAIWCCSN